MEVASCQDRVHTVLAIIDGEKLEEAFELTSAVLGPTLRTPWSQVAHANTQLCRTQPRTERVFRKNAQKSMQLSERDEGSNVADVPT